jgi:hypothetical protein
MSTALAWLLSLGALIGFKKVPASASAAFIVLLRVVVVSLTNPAAQFKYVYGLYLLGFILPVLLWAEYRRGIIQSRNTAKALGPNSIPSSVHSEASSNPKRR